MGYSELVQRLFEKNEFFLWTPYRRNRTVGSNFDVTSHSCLIGVLRRRLQTFIDFGVLKM
jgi:hypothetical protein